MTVAATKYKVKVPYGVLKLAGHLLLGMEEKPEQSFYCNGGIYVINPEILRRIPQGQAFGMNDLLELVLQRGPARGRPFRSTSPGWTWARCPTWSGPVARPTAKEEGE